MSVWGTGTGILLGVFSWQCGVGGLEAYAPAGALDVSFELEPWIFLRLPPYDAGSPVAIERPAYPAASPHRTLSESGSHGMLTVCPSATPFGLALGPD